MKFLVVLMVVFFYRNWVGDNPVRRHVAFDGYVRWFKQRISATNVCFLVGAGVPVIVTFLVAGEIRHWILGLPWILFSAAVLVYSIEANDTDLAFDDEAEALRSVAADSSLSEVHKRQADFRLVVTYDAFQGIYPALFWFLILGPAGALAYTLTRQYLDQLDDDDPEIDLVEQVQYWLEWPAAQLTGLVFALLGRFGECFDAWLASIGNTSEAIGSLLVRLASAATVVVDPAVETGVDAYARESEVANAELKDLLGRTVYGWLAVAALVVIIGF